MSDSPTDKAKHLSAALPTKKPYVAPVLRPWGTLRDLTLSVGSTGASDSGKSKFSNRTR